MKNAILSSLSVILLAVSGMALASDMHGMNPADRQSRGHAIMQVHKAEGVLNRIDLQHKQINLTHGPVKSLGWPGMTMSFMIKDASILKGIQPGQRVAFEIVKEAPKTFYVSKITALK
ncbi:MAG: copper-binding protein [Gallionella sp.]